MNRKLLLIAAFSLLSSTAVANEIVDYNKTVIAQTPYIVEVCRDENVSGDKTGDTLKGALLGGIIGNNIKGEQDGGAIGAIIGGMLGHANSNSTVATRNVCTRETRYKETEKTIYSHSTITFIHEGVTYMLRFNKK
jgi:uncharacterized protein YcfJ